MITWDVKIHPEGPRDPEVMKRLELGGPAAHALFAIGMTTTDGGGLAVVFHGYHAREGEPHPVLMGPAEQFKAWLMAAAHLGGLAGLDDERRTFARLVFEGFFSVAEDPGGGSSSGPVH